MVWKAGSFNENRENLVENILVCIENGNFLNYML